MRVGVRLQDLMDVDTLAADVAHEVRGLGGRRDHVSAGATSRSAFSAAAGRECGEHGAGEEEEEQPRHATADY